MEAITSAIIELLVAVLVAVILILARAGAKALKRWQQAAEIQAKDELAEAAVLFAQQFYRSLRGPERYDQAAAWLVARLNAIGMAVDEDEVRGTIEAALKRLKLEWGNAWRDSGLPPDDPDDPDDLAILRQIGGTG